MTIAGSRYGAPRSVLCEIGERAKVANPGAIIDEVVEAVSRWPDHADAARVLPEHAALIAAELAETTLAD